MNEVGTKNILKEYGNLAGVRRFHCKDNWNSVRCQFHVAHVSCCLRGNGLNKGILLCLEGNILACMTNSIFQNAVFYIENVRVERKCIFCTDT